MKISIIIPFYNRCTEIIDTLISICLQDIFFINLLNLSNYGIKVNYKVSLDNYNNDSKINKISDGYNKYQNIRNYIAEIKLKESKFKNKSIFDDLYYIDYEVIIVDDFSECDVKNSILTFFNKNEDYIIEYIENLNKKYKFLDKKILNKIKINKNYFLNHIKKFLEKIKIIRNNTNKGVSYSRNRGLIKSTGNIIFFIDSDDLWVSNKLRIHLIVLSLMSNFDLLDVNSDTYANLYQDKYSCDENKIKNNLKSNLITELTINIFEEKRNNIILVKRLFNIELFNDRKLNNLYYQNSKKFHFILNDEIWYRKGVYVNKPDDFDIFTLLSNDKLYKEFFKKTIFAISSVSFNRELLLKFKKEYGYLFNDKYRIGEDFDFFLKIIFFVNPLIIFNKLNIKKGGSKDQLSYLFKKNLLINKVEIYGHIIKSKFFKMLKVNFKHEIMKSYKKSRIILKKYIKF